MGDVLAWKMEQHACDIRIGQLTASLRKWDAEEEALLRFRLTAEDTGDMFADRNRGSLQAVRELEEIADVCLTAGRYGTAMEERLQTVGGSRVAAAFGRLMERIEKELQAYRLKQESARSELSQASALREQLAVQIREAQEE